MLSVQESRLLHKKREFFHAKLMEIEMAENPQKKQGANFSKCKDWRGIPSCSRRDESNCRGVNIGEDCAAGVNVIIGYVIKDNRSKGGAPEIGDRVYIGHNSTIVGRIKIGNDVLIAPNSYVNKDVPDNSIVIGNNIIIPKEKPSKNYIKLVP